MDKINEVKNNLGDRATNPHLGMERQIALDALNVITEQESEIARLRLDIMAARDAADSAEMSAKCSRALKEKAESENIELLEKCRRLELANEQLRLKLDGQRDRIVKLSAERDEKNKAVEDLKRENKDLLNVASDAKNETDMYRVSVDYWRTRYNDVCGTKEMLVKTNNELVEARDRAIKETHELREKLHEATVKASSFVVDPDEIDSIRIERCPVCKNDFRFFLKRSRPVMVKGESIRKYAACPTCGNGVNNFENKTACGRCGTPLDWGSEGGK